MVRVVLAVFGGLGLAVVCTTAFAQPTPGGPLRSTIPVTAGSLEPSPSHEDPIPSLAFGPAPPTPSLEASTLPVTLEPALEAESGPVSVTPLVLEPSDGGAPSDAEASALGEQLPSRQLVEDFDRQVDQAARRWEFTMRLVEERERRDVAAYVAGYVLEQRKRMFTRQLIEQRVAAQAAATELPVGVLPSTTEKIE